MSPNRELVEQTITRDRSKPLELAGLAAAGIPDKYEVLSFLGRGGFGIVYKARDRSLDRFVALKILTDARPTDLERFRREARFAARLNDPSIVQVYEFGEHSATPYIAMQFVDGESLADREMTRDDAISAVRTAAMALQRAHAIGIVHRDVKPANILLDRDGRAYLTDFGIARDIQGTTGPTLSQEGALMGTPGLMPPEQARGDLHAIDARSDVYSLGATLFYLLCRRYPFSAPNIVDLLHAVLHVAPPSPRAIDPSIPLSLEAIILRCMQKDRARRYASMAALVEDLDAYLGGRLTDGEAAAGVRGPAGPEAPRAAPEPDLYQTVGFEIVRQIADWDANLYRVSRNITRFDTQLESIIDRLDRIIDDHPDVAWARFYRGVALMRLGRLPEALDEMERSIDRLANQADAQFEMGRLYMTLFLREQNRAARHFSRTGTRHHLASHRGRLQQAVVCFSEACRLRSDAGHWQMDFAEAVARLADDDPRGCVEVCDRILNRDPDVEDVWKLRGDALRLADADPLPSYDEAIRVRRSFSEAHLAKAEYQSQRGAWAEARVCLRQALEIRPEAVDLLAQMARSFLMEARAPIVAIPGLIGADQSRARRALLADAFGFVDRALAIDPRNYEPVVTRAELLLESARLHQDADDFEAPLTALESARSLDGCQNRVNYLVASTLFERSNRRVARGEDPRDDLRKVLELATGPQLEVADNSAWINVRAAAQRELNRLSSANGATA